jgi:hypothetical protein
MTHRAADEAQGPGNGRGVLTLFRPLQDNLTQWQGDRMWHEQSSLE